MLNKTERMQVCELIATWRWAGMNVTSSSEVAISGRHAEALQSLFKIAKNDPDLLFEETCCVAKYINIDMVEHDEEFDKLYTLLETDYEKVCDLLDSTFDGVEKLWDLLSNEEN